MMPAVQYALELWPGAADGSRLVARLEAIRKGMTSRLQFSPTWMPAMRPRLKFPFMSHLRQSSPFRLDSSLPLLGEASLRRRLTGYARFPRVVSPGWPGHREPTLGGQRRRGREDGPC